jgi:hypothetical protein
MPNTFSTLLVAPLMGWLTLLALLVVGYLGRLEYLERRKNRRLDEKRAQISKGAPLKPKTPRPLAIRTIVEVSPLDSNCPIVGRAFQKFDRHGTLNFRAINFN